MADLTDEERRMLVEILDLYTDSLPISDDAEGRDYDAALATLKAKLRDSGPITDDLPEGRPS